MPTHQDSQYARSSKRMRQETSRRSGDVDKHIPRPTATRGGNRHRVGNGSLDPMTTLDHSRRQRRDGVSEGGNSTEQWSSQDEGRARRRTCGSSPGSSTPRDESDVDRRRGSPTETLAGVRRVRKADSGRVKGFNSTTVLETLRDITQEMEDGEIQESSPEDILQLIFLRLDPPREAVRAMLGFFLERIQTPPPGGVVSVSVQIVGAAAGDAEGKKGGLSGLGTACSTVASIMAPFTQFMCSGRGKAGSATLREDMLEDAVVGSAYALVMHGNAPEYRGSVKAHFLRHFGQNLRSAKSKVTIAHRKALGTVFDEHLETFDAPPSAGGVSLKSALRRHLEEGINNVPTARWMDAGREAMATVVDQHQKTLKGGVNENMRLTLLDLIRSEEDDERKKNAYVSKVLLFVAEEVLVEGFLHWVSKKESMGMVLTTGTLHDLRHDFMRELEGGGKSLAVEADESGMGDEKGRGRKESAKTPWSVEKGGRDLRTTFSTTLFKALGRVFAGRMGIALDNVGMQSSMESLNAVFRPYAVKTADRRGGEQHDMAREKPGGESDPGHAAGAGDGDAEPGAGSGRDAGGGGVDYADDEHRDEDMDLGDDDRDEPHEKAQGGTVENSPSNSGFSPSR